MRAAECRFFTQVLILLCFFISLSLQFDPEDNYLIDCGSSVNTTVDNRVFLADVDDDSSSFLSTPENVFVDANPNSVPSSSYGVALYQTARIFNGSSQYTFPIKKKERHWIRLHFFPFANQTLNLSSSRFSVSAQSFTFLKDFQPSGIPSVKEYTLNVTSDSLVLGFSPSADSFAFLNALEVVSLPDEVIPAGYVRAVGGSRGGSQENLENSALETVIRVNMGNETVLPRNDTLSRVWLSDSGFLSNSNLVLFVRNVGFVNYSRSREGVTENIGPKSVYGTATKLNSALDERNVLNVTWLFEVDPGFDYFVRFHFCNILDSVSKNLLFFNVFLNSEFAAKDLNLSTSGAPHYLDVITRLRSDGHLPISIGSSSSFNSWPDRILNGLEVMKMSNSKGSLDPSDAEIQAESSSSSSSKTKVWVFVGSAIGVVAFIALVLVFVLLSRRRKRKNMVHSTVQDQQEKSAFGNSSLISKSKRGYRFPFAVVREATDNFSESLIIGVGGFGKVYKGVLSDGTRVAVKRGVTDSRQGLAEFKTEIEMLSQFRHRHLVSLIGYCDEKSEMIIIYEFMENGSLKDHIHGLNNHPKLNWKQRLEICIGSARGLHYLHTGSSVKAIIHRDVKSANILLDENLLAKVADFGISKLGPDVDQTHVSTAVKGSFGYLDPEYLTMQQLTEKSDVYSFGVVMVEVLSGRPVIDPSRAREEVNMVEWAMRCISRGEVEKIVDSEIASEVKGESLNKFRETLEKCLAEFGANRPGMGDVLWNLECALQLQVGDPREQNKEQSSSNVENLDLSVASSGEFGSFAGFSMRRAFSQMIRAENGAEQNHQQNAI